MKTRDQIALALFTAALGSPGNPATADLLMYLCGRCVVSDEYVKEMTDDQREKNDARAKEYEALEGPARDQAKALWSRCCEMADALGAE